MQTWPGEASFCPLSLRYRLLLAYLIAKFNMVVIVWVWFPCPVVCRKWSNVMTGLLNFGPESGTYRSLKKRFLQTETKTETGNCVAIHGKRQRGRVKPLEYPRRRHALRILIGLEKEETLSRRLAVLGFAFRQRSLLGYSAFFKK